MKYARKNTDGGGAQLLNVQLRRLVIIYRFNYTQQCWRYHTARDECIKICRLV